MKKIIIISFTKLKIYLITVIVISSILGYLLIVKDGNHNAVQVLQTEEDNQIKDLQFKNSRLKGALLNILPDEDKTMYADPYRLHGIRPPTYQTLPLSQVVDKGKPIHFNIINTHPEYKRPLYDSWWKDFFFRSWLYLPYKITDAHHRLFVFPLGGSSNFDFTGEQGFKIPNNIDAHKNINFLVYNFHVDTIKQYNDQVALIGEPKRTGATMISILQDDLLERDINEKELLFQLATPKGYEIDFISYRVIRYDYLMEQIKKHTVQGTFSSSSDEKTLQELQEENLRIKKELSYFIPIQDDAFITEQKCRNAYSIPLPNQTHDILTVKDTGINMDFNMLYKNSEFVRPIYDPIWKENYLEGWAYIPTKLCENMHLLFALPADDKQQSDKLNNLAVHENIPYITEDQIGLLMFNFTPQQIFALDNQIIIIGTPERKGLYILTINKKNMKDNQPYLVQLVTQDDLELDYEMIQ